jgi:small-conductance mechanosensitive channel
MQVSRNSWHTRVYLWWYTHKYNNGYKPTDKTSSNLCPYVRAVLFWAPLRLLFWDWVKLWESATSDWYISLNMFTIPLMAYFVPLMLGYVNYYLKFVLWMTVISVAVLAVIIVGLTLSCIKIKEELDAYRALHYNDPPKPKRKTPEFFTLVQAYLRAGHDGICPEVEIVD